MEETLNKKTLSIVIPCFNEAAIISNTIGSVTRYFQENLQTEWNLELLPIDDGSTDETAPILKSLKSPSLLPQFHPKNLGRGAAMKTGIQAASGDYLLFLDADLSYDVDHISDVLKAFKENPSVDTIIVSPYMKGGVAKNIPISRLILSRAANWILSGFFSRKISTVTSMVRAYRTERIKQLPLLESGKEIHLEILRKAVLLDYEILEIPGRLIWKEQKNRSQRLNKKKVAGAATNHVFYGILAKPTRLLANFSLLVLLIGIYEAINLLIVTAQLYENQGEFWRSLWKSLSLAYNQSPHSFFITGICLLLSVQLISFLTLFKLLKMQNDELLKHLIMLNKDKK